MKTWTSRHGAASRGIAGAVLLAALCVMAATAPLANVAITKENDLAFPTPIIQNETDVVIHTDAEAARFKIELTGKKPNDNFMDLTFTLPASIPGASGSMPVSFGASSAGWSQNPSSATATTFDPNAGTTISLSGGCCATYYVWVGGTAEPNLSSPSGDYSGTLTLQVNIY